MGTGKGWSIRERDDELAFARHAANDPDDPPHDRARRNAAYASRAYALYGKVHAERAAGMVVTAVGLAPGGWPGRRVRDLARGGLRQRPRQAGMVGECERS